MTTMDAEWAILKPATDVPVVTLSDKKARAIGTHARTARAIAVMVPDERPQLKPQPKPAAPPAAEEEAPMHDEIPDDPAELQAALVAKIGGIAELIELKRREGSDPQRSGRDPEPRSAATAPQRLSG